MVAKFISVLCNIIATLLGWGSFAISVAACAVADWMRENASNTGTRVGLFEYCEMSADNDDVCSPIADSQVNHKGYAVRAFIIMMTIFGGLAGLINISSQIKPNTRSLRASSTVKYVLAGCCGLIGCAIFTYIKENDYPFRYIYGSAYIMAWISCWGFYIASLFQGVSACTAPRYEIH